MKGQQSALSLVGSKLVVCSFPCLDIVVTNKPSPWTVFTDSFNSQRLIFAHCAMLIAQICGYFKMDMRFVGGQINFLIGLWLLELHTLYIVIFKWGPEVISLLNIEKWATRSIIVCTENKYEAMLRHSRFSRLGS